MARYRRKDPDQLLRRLILATLAVACVLVALAQQLGDRFLSWAWPIFALLPLWFWGLLALQLWRRLQHWRRQRGQARAQRLVEPLERTCAGSWGTAQFRGMLGVFLAPDSLHISIPPFMLIDAESLRIPHAEVRSVQVRAGRLATACRIAFYEHTGQLAEFTLYPRRPRQFVAALRGAGLPVTVSGALPAHALVYSLREAGWLLFWIIWLSL